MTNQIAIALGVMILAGLGVDAVYFDWTNSLFVARKFLELLEWLAFWR